MGTTIGSGSTLQLSAAVGASRWLIFIENGTIDPHLGTWPNFANPISGSGGLTISRSRERDAPGHEQLLLRRHDDQRCDVADNREKPPAQWNRGHAGQDPGSQLVLNANQTIGGFLRRRDRSDQRFFLGRQCLWRLFLRFLGRDRRRRSGHPSAPLAKRRQRRDRDLQRRHNTYTGGTTVNAVP